METRERVTYKLQPSKDSPDNGPMSGFNLVQTRTTETRRSRRDSWREDYSTQATVATFTRPQLAEHVADAADALAWVGD